MRNDWPWMGLTAGIGVVIFSYVRTLLGFADEQIGKWPAVWAGSLIVFIVYEIVLQVRWKANATNVMDDVWCRPGSDDVSRAKIFYVVGVVALCTVTASLGAIIILEPRSTGYVLAKAAGGIAMGRTFLILARRA